MASSKKFLQAALKEENTVVCYFYSFKHSCLFNFTSYIHNILCFEYIVNFFIFFPLFVPLDAGVVC